MRERSPNRQRRISARGVISAILPKNEDLDFDSPLKADMVEYTGPRHDDLRELARVATALGYDELAEKYTLQAENKEFRSV